MLDQTCALPICGSAEPGRWAKSPGPSWFSPLFSQVFLKGANFRSAGRVEPGRGTFEKIGVVWGLYRASMRHRQWQEEVVIGRRAALIRAGVLRLAPL